MKGMNSHGYRKYFMGVLWESRHKWPTLFCGMPTLQSKNQDFKIHVSCRFRPGDRRYDNIHLPLHQFLKIKRTQNASQDLSREHKSILVGEEDPEEFLDPILRTLMKDPVILSTSNRIVDRSVAVQSVLRGGKDPFNGRKLVMSHLQPLPELRQAIMTWKQRKENMYARLVFIHNGSLHIWDV